MEVKLDDKINGKGCVCYVPNIKMKLPMDGGIN